MFEQGGPMQRKLKLWLFMLPILAFSSHASDIELKVKYLKTIVEKINEFTKESETLLFAINKNQYWISLYHNASGAFIVLMPYSLSWLIDAYYPQGHWIKENLHYSFTPISQAFAILTVQHNFSKATIKTKKASGLLRESYQFFHDLEQVCKNLQGIILGIQDSSKKYELIENYLDSLRQEGTPVGNYLLSTYHELQKSQSINFTYEPTHGVLCQIFSSILETIKNTKTTQIKENKTILNINGIKCSSYNCLNISILQGIIVDNFKSSGFDKKKKTAVPFLETHHQ
jgi:hypothetical protein